VKAHLLAELSVSGKINPEVARLGFQIHDDLVAGHRRQLTSPARPGKAQRAAGAARRSAEGGDHTELRLEGGALVRNAEFLRFAEHWVCTPRACRPYRLQTKGKVERPCAT